MHYLVTGGAGFIGSHLCDALLGAGHQVSVIDNLSTGKKANLADAVQLIEGDCANADLLNDIIESLDGIFHLAAVASVQQSTEQWSATSHTNQFATIALLEKIKERKAGPIPFVYASSAAVFGDPNASYLPLKEDTPTVPLTPYGADKLGSEHHARIAQHLFGIPTMGLRFFNVYGPRQDPSSPYSGVISIFANRIPQGKPITIFGDGSQTRDFIFVADVVAYLANAMRALHDGALQTHAVNICTGAATSILELAHHIADISGKEAVIDHADARAGDIVHSVGNASLAQSLLNHTAKTVLKDGLKETIG